MTLRQKTFIAIALTFASLFGVLHYLFDHVLARHLVELEQIETHENIVRVRNALQQELSHLDRSVQDWAQWDDTYNYVRTKNREYENDNLNDDGLSPVRVNVLLLVNSSGRVVFGTDYDTEAAQKKPLFSGAAPLIKTCLTLLSPGGAKKDNITGLFVTDTAPLMVVARRVLRSDGAGPPAGILIFGRYLNAAQLRTLSDVAQVPLHIWPWPQNEQKNDLPADVKQAHRILQRGISWIHPLDDDIVAGYTRLDGLQNQPVLIVRADVKRDIWKHGQLTARMVDLILLLVGAVFGVMTLLLMDRVMLRRMSLLSQDVSAIGTGQDHALRVRMDGSDEISHLALCINTTLEQLQALHAEVELRVSERTQELSAANQRLQSEAAERLIMMTQLRKAVADLQQAKEEAERANQATNTFLSRVSHELRTPLNAIIGFTQLLEWEELTPDQHEHVQYVLKAGNHLLQLINDVLDISSVESGDLSLCMEPLSLPRLASEAITLIHPLAHSMQVSVKLCPPAPNGALAAGSDANFYVRSDAQRVKQVLLNLLSNAIKYNKPMGLVEVGMEKTDEHWVRLWVRDQGMGIAPEKMGRLFQPFDRLGAEATPVEGTGIGLALCKSLIGLMGGTIGVSSTVGAGSTFWIELPAADHNDILRENAPRAVPSPS